jgi:hypothetical protein
MEISFTRGDTHKEKFRFKTYTGSVDNMFFTVKCENKYIRVTKKLGQGIELIDGWYHLTFKPEDTDGIDCSLNMKYDIEIIVQGEKYTIQKGNFLLDEDVTTPECEV